MKVLSILLISCMLFSCSGDENIPPGDLLLRVKNVSPYKYENIVVNTGDGEKDFGFLDPSQTSAYQSFEIAYRYAYVKLSINGETYIIQPIDYVGEEPLPSGKYTYLITASTSDDRYGRLGIDLQED